MYGHVITKFSRMGSLPYFLTNGAPLRALRLRELRYKKNAVCIIAYLYWILLILDIIITKLNRRFSHAPNLTRDVTALRWDVESTKFDSFKLNTTLSNLRLKQSKI